MANESSNMLDVREAVSFVLSCDANIFEILFIKYHIRCALCMCLDQCLNGNKSLN